MSADRRPLTVAMPAEQSRALRALRHQSVLAVRDLMAASAGDVGREALRIRVTELWAALQASKPFFESQAAADPAWVPPEGGERGEYSWMRRKDAGVG